MSPPPYSAKVPLLKCTPDCGTHLKDTLSLIPGLSLSPALSKSRSVIYPLDKNILENVTRSMVLGTGRALSGPR